MKRHSEEYDAKVERLRDLGRIIRFKFDDHISGGPSLVPVSNNTEAIALLIELLLLDGSA